MGIFFGLLLPVKQRVLPHLEVCAWCKTPREIVFPALGLPSHPSQLHSCFRDVVLLDSVG